MRIVFIGCVKSSYVLLRALLEDDKTVCGVITKKESIFNSDFYDLKPLCMEFGIQSYYTDDINNKETKELIRIAKPDIIYCFGWSALVDSEIIRSAPKGVVGFHPAALPYNKGRHPIIWALILGLKKTASSFFMIDENADSGAVVSQQEIRISFEDDAGMLYDKILLTAKQQLIEFTDAFEKNKIELVEQPNGVGNVWRKRTKNDGKIDFRMSATSIYNLVRGLTKPYVGAHFVFSKKEYKVWKTEIVTDEKNTYLNIEPGKVLKVFSNRSFLIKVGEGMIKIIDCDDVKVKDGDYL